MLLVLSNCMLIEVVNIMLLALSNCMLIEVDIYKLSEIYYIKMTISFEFKKSFLKYMKGRKLPVLQLTIYKQDN